MSVEIGQQHGNSFTHQPATIYRDPVTAQRQPGPLEIEELGRGQVHSDLLRVRLAAAGLAARSGGRPWGGRPEQFSDTRQAHPARTGPARSACRHRSSTSLASSR